MKVYSFIGLLECAILTVFIMGIVFIILLVLIRNNDDEENDKNMKNKKIIIKKELEIANDTKKSSTDRITIDEKINTKKISDQELENTLVSKSSNDHRSKENLNQTLDYVKDDEKIRTESNLKKDKTFDFVEDDGKIRTEFNKKILTKKLDFVEDNEKIGTESNLKTNEKHENFKKHLQSPKNLVKENLAFDDLKSISHLNKISPVASISTDVIEKNDPDFHNERKFSKRDSNFENEKVFKQARIIAKKVNDNNYEHKESDNIANFSQQNILLIQEIDEILLSLNNDDDESKNSLQADERIKNDLENELYNSKRKIVIKKNEENTFEEQNFNEIDDTANTEFSIMQDKLFKDIIILKTIEESIAAERENFNFKNKKIIENHVKEENNQHEKKMQEETLTKQRSKFSYTDKDYEDPPVVSYESIEIKDKKFNDAVSENNKKLKLQNTSLNNTDFTSTNTENDNINLIEENSDVFAPESNTEVLSDLYELSITRDCLYDNFENERRERIIEENQKQKLVEACQNTEEKCIIENITDQNMGLSTQQNDIEIEQKLDLNDENLQHNDAKKDDVKDKTKEEIENNFKKLPEESKKEQIDNIDNIENEPNPIFDNIINVEKQVKNFEANKIELLNLNNFNDIVNEESEEEVIFERETDKKVKENIDKIFMEEENMISDYKIFENLTDKIAPKIQNIDEIIQTKNDFIESSITNKNINLNYFEEEMDATPMKSSKLELSVQTHNEALKINEQSEENDENEVNDENDKKENNEKNEEIEKKNKNTDNEENEEEFMTKDQFEFVYKDFFDESLNEVNHETKNDESKPDDNEKFTDMSEM